MRIEIIKKFYSVTIIGTNKEALGAKLPKISNAFKHYLIFFSTSRTLSYLKINDKQFISELNTYDN